MNDTDALSSKLQYFSALMVRESKSGCLAVCLFALTTTGVLQLPPSTYLSQSLAFWSLELRSHNVLALPAVMECALVETMEESLGSSEISQRGGSTFQRKAQIKRLCSPKLDG